MHCHVLLLLLLLLLLLFELHSTANQYKRQIKAWNEESKEINTCTDGQLAQLTSSQKKKKIVTERLVGVRVRGEMKWNIYHRDGKNEKYRVEKDQTWT